MRVRRPRRGDEAALTVEVPPTSKALRKEWESLASVNGNIFATFEFASAWLAHLRDDESALVATCRRRDGSTAGVLPLVVTEERGLRVVRMIGHGAAERLAPPCADEERPLVAAALREFLLAGDCDLFLGEQVPAEEGWAQMLGGTVLGVESSPVLSIDGRSWDEYLTQQSANFRQQVRKREKRLAKQGQLSFRLTEDADELAADMETFLDLHDSRWAEQGSTSFAGRVRDVHREFAPVALANGWLRLWFLELDGQPLAAWYGFRFGDAEWAYQTGRDPAAERAAVGFVIYAHSIRAAMEDGVREYRLLRGDAAYKLRFADGDATLERFAVPISARGRARLLAMRARPAVGSALRRLRPRRDLR